MSKMFTVMVTGAGGQLGQELVRLQISGVRLVGFRRDELDITDADACAYAVASVKPDAIIHCAAYTAVDKAESDPETAYHVNVEGTRNMAIAAEAAGTKFCYISTDYVFNGRESNPYQEDAPTEPQTVYGRTKLQGEKAAMSTCRRTFVVRTSWIYGRYGANFVRTMLQLAEQKRPVSVVNDQVGSPTYTYDLALFLLELVRADGYGTYHASNTGSCTWYQFAQAIFAQSELDVDLTPCTTDQFVRQAPRPAYSVLGHEAMRRAGFAPLRHWREALSAFLHRN